MRLSSFAFSLLLFCGTASAQITPPLQVAANGSNVATPQRYRLNLISTALSCVNNGTTKSYDCTWLTTVLAGRNVLTTAPTSSQVLTWNGSAWAPADLPASGAVTINTASPMGGGGSLSPGGTLNLTCTGCATSSSTTTFTNKSISGSTNTITNIAQSSVTNLVSDLSAKVPTSRLINTTTPIQGGGDGSADLTLSLASAGITNALLQNPSATVNTTSPIAGGGTLTLGSSLTLTCSLCVQTSRTISTSPELTGGGDLSTNRTIGIASAGVTNAMLANPSATVTTTSPIGGGGTLTLGAGLTLTCTTCVVDSGSYSNPSWITALAGAKISGTVANATAAVSFSGSLSGDVTGTQGATVVGKLQGVTVAATPPTDTYVLTYDLATTSWKPAASAGGGSLFVDAPLAGAGTTGSHLTCTTCLTASPTTTGDTFYSTAGGVALSRLGAVASGSYMRSAGTGTAPVWSTLILPNSATTGDLHIATSANTIGNLAAVASGAYLRSAGTSTAPVWSTLVLPNSATTGDLHVATSANTIGNLAAVATGSFLYSQGTSTAPVWSTLTIPNAATTGDIPYASASNTLTMLADVAAGSYMRSGGTSTAPVWSTVTLPNAATTNQVMVATGTNIFGVATSLAGLTLTTSTLTSPIINTATSTVSTAFYAGSAANAHGLTITPFITDTTSVAATVGVQKASRGIEMCSNGWKTTATAGSQAVCDGLYSLPIQNSTTPSASLVWYTNINAAGKTARMNFVYDPVASTTKVYGASTTAAYVELDPGELRLYGGSGSSNTIRMTSDAFFPSVNTGLALGGAAFAWTAVYTMGLEVVALNATTCTVGAGAGTGATCAVQTSSALDAGAIDVTTAGTPTGSDATIVTVNAGAGNQWNAKGHCHVAARDATTALVFQTNGIYAVGAGTSTATIAIKNPAVAGLTTATVYKFTWLCTGAN